MGIYMDRTVEYIESLDISKDGYIVVGCSGGPDSMCLLNILYDRGYKIVCAHVNHNIRKESKDEEEFLKNYCKERKIIFEVLELPHYDDKSESFYRSKRYTFYKNLCNKYKTNILMTAHHGDDLIETILMRITRGSHLHGYVGFKKDYLEYGIRIIKPLIFYNKDEIISFNKMRGIPYVIDKTNEKDSYTRNRYRHKVLPFLKEECREIHLKYLAFSEELESANDYIDRVVDNAINENFKDDVIDLEKFSVLDDYIKRKELERIFKRVYGDDGDKLKKEHATSIIELIKKGQNFTFTLPLDYLVRREYGMLSITKKRESEAYEKILKDKVVFENGYTIEIVEDSFDHTNFTTRLNSKELKLPLKVRTRKPGDKMKIKNMEGYKKIKNIMIDEKVPPSKRDAYPIVVDAEDRIVWLPGLRKSEFDNENNEKYDIILKYTKKGEKN